MSQSRAMSQIYTHTIKEGIIADIGGGLDPNRKMSLISALDILVKSCRF